MNKEDYVSLEVAKLLKLKGFDEQCRYTYCGESEEDVGVSNNKNSNYPKSVYSMPTLYDAAKWLRNKHKLHIDVGMCGDYATDADWNKCDGWDFWTFDMYSTENFNHHIFDCFGQYDTYEEALNAGILEALKLI